MRLNLMKNLFSSDSKKKSSARRNGPRQFKTTFDLLEDRRMLSATWWVGSVAADFADIQSAINAPTVHNGDNIKVEPGTYPDAAFSGDTVTVNKSLNILGGQVRNSSQAPGASIVTSDGVGFTLLANDITINNFTITPTGTTQGTAGIATDGSHSGYRVLNNIIEDEAAGVHLNTSVLSSAHQSTIQGNRFQPLAGPFPNTDGILSDVGARNVTIQNNIFTGDTDASVKFVGTLQSSNICIVGNQINNDAPILVTNLTKSQITGNSVVNPNTTDTALTAAIFLGGGVTSTSVYRNTVIAGASTPDTMNGIELGLYNSGANNQPNNNNDVESNTIAGNGTVFADGILVDGASVNAANKNTIACNTVNNVASNGIALVGGAASNTVASNTSMLSGLNGILVDHSNNNTISRNNVSNNDANGIDLETANLSTVSGNKVNFNGAIGIFLTASNQNKILNNTANNNSDQGINSQGDFNTISGNTTNFNAIGGLDSGIFVSLSTNNVITCNTSNNNGDSGITLEGVTNSSVTSNTTNFNGVNGIDLFASGTSSTTGNTVSGNTAKFNGASGILLDGSGWNTLSKNTASNNTTNGISLVDASTNNTLTRNTANYNLHDGIEVSTDSTGNTINRNTALNNTNFDLEDDSLLTTNNTWTNNTANSRNPAGLG